MSTAPQLPPRPGAQGAAAWERLSTAGSEDAFLEAWLELQAALLNGVRRGVVVLGSADAGPYAPRAFWPAHESAVGELADVAERALAERTPLVHRLGAGGAVPLAAMPFGVAFPIEVDGHLHGVVAVEVTARSEAELQGTLRQLQWGGAWLEAWLRREAQKNGNESAERMMTALDILATALNEPTFDEAARAVVTELAMRFECERVSLGVVRRGRSRVVALSHSAQFGKRMNLIDAIAAAMDEAIDQRGALLLPPAQADVLVTRDHERLAREHGCDCILTIPFSAGERFSGALLFERPAHQPFDAATVEACRATVAVLARLLEVRHANDIPLAVRVWRAAAGQLGRLIGPRYVKRKLFAAGFVAAVAFFSVATAEYRVTAPSTLEGALRRTLAAPFDGYIASAERRAGDVVRAGAVLATLDDRDLRIERLRWAAQHEQYLKQYNEAVGSRDRARAQIARAQADQARAQMALFDEQLSRARLRAPFDGIVAKGDLSQSLGAAVRRGETMFELTPLDSWRVILQVDEGEIAALEPGQKGRLVLASIADDTFDFTVRRITPVTTSKDGRNYFRVEADLAKGSPRLRPGMEGVAKVEAGERKLFWIATHRLENWLRLFFWTWWP